MIKMIFYCTTEMRALSTTTRKIIYTSKILYVISWKETLIIL